MCKKIEEYVVLLWTSGEDVITYKSRRHPLLDQIGQDGGSVRLQADMVQQLQQQTEAARDLLKSDPENSFYNAQLGTLLQHLDYISPDGGSRIPEAEQAYR